VGQVGDAAGFCLCHYADVEDLDEEPEPDQKRGGDQGDPKKNDEEDECADAVAGKGNDECAHHGGDSSAGTERGDAREGIAQDLRGHGNDAADEIKDGEADGAHRVFNFAAEGPQVNHVADDVHPAGVHEH